MLAATETAPLLAPVALARALLEVEVREAEPETAPEEAAVVPEVAAVVAAVVPATELLRSN